MSSNIVFMKDDTVSVVSLNEGVDPVKEAKRLSLDEYEIVDSSIIPADRTFRDAWVHEKTESENKIAVRVGLARDISLARVRSNRDEKLKELDIAYTVASRTGASTDDLDVQRQILLDSTEAIKDLDLDDDSIITVEEAANTLIPLELLDV